MGLTGTVALAALVAARGIELELALALPFAALLIAVAGIDLEHRMIPNALVAPAVAYGLVAGSLIDSEAMPERMAAGAGALVFLLVPALACPAGMGMGDVKLAGAMGLYLGITVVPALLVAFVTGTIVGAATVVRDGASARKKRSLRTLPGPGGLRRAARGTRDHRPVPGSVRPLTRALPTRLWTPWRSASQRPASRTVRV